jgi:hypothetical protein
MNNGIYEKLTRKSVIIESQPQRHTHIARAAANLSRRNVDQATVELLNEAHARLIVLCYERDESGQLCNVDPATGKVLIPLPWGKSGHAKWGIAPSEADALRAIMFARQQNGVPLFHFDRSRRAWYVNLADHPALPVLAEWQISVAEYREARGDGGA